MATESRLQRVARRTSYQQHPLHPIHPLHPLHSLHPIHPLHLLYLPFPFPQARQYQHLATSVHPHQIQALAHRSARAQKLALALAP